MAVTVNCCVPRADVKIAAPFATGPVQPAMAMPESASEQVKLAAMLNPCGNPDPVCGVTICTLGGVRSMLTASAATALVLPAKSTQVPDASCVAPSLASVTFDVQPSTPDPLMLSVPENETVTVELFQPLAFGGGAAVVVATGGTVSILMPDAVNVVVLPAMFEHEPLTDSPLPLVLRVIGPLHASAATPDSGSVAAKLNVTGLLYQPLAFGDELAMSLTTGPANSMLMFVAETGMLMFPALSVQVPDGEVS